MVQYIIQVVVIQFVFLAVYDLWLRKETFFNYNRAFLLTSLGLSFVIPFLKFSVPQESLVTTVNAVLPEIVLNPSEVLKDFNSSFSMASMFETVLYLGILILGVAFIYKLFKIYRLISEGDIIEQEVFKLVVIKQPYSAFSFFNFIFINKRILESNSEIIRHEMVHAREKHSLDLLFVELLKIVMWFNPLIYIFHKRIAEVHEFISDAEVVQDSNKKQYLNTLLGVTFKVQNISFTNQFYTHSLIKKRIIMMTKQKSNQVKVLKYISVLPLIAAMLFYVSCSDASKEQDVVVEGKEVITKKNIENSYPIDDDSVGFQNLEEVPKFSGATGSKEALQRDFQQKLTAHVIDNFNFKLGDELELAPDTYKVFVSFIIDKDGTISKAKAKGPRPELEQEAIRVVKSLPQLEPGKVEGKAVNVKYSLPIAFKVE